MPRKTAPRTVTPTSKAQVPEGFLQALDDDLQSIQEILQTFDLLASLLDPLVVGEKPIIEADLGHLGVMLRILNSAFFHRLSAARGLVTRVMR